MAIGREDLERITQFFQRSREDLQIADGNSILFKLVGRPLEFLDQLPADGVLVGRAGRTFGRIQTFRGNRFGIGHDRCLVSDKKYQPSTASNASSRVS